MEKRMNPGDIILATIQFTDTFEVKTRPAFVLWVDRQNITIAGLTSNTVRAGVPYTKKDGAFLDSVIRLDYVFTIDASLVQRKITSAPKRICTAVRKEIEEKMLSL
jgi:hypothetical protein